MNHIVSVKKRECQGSFPDISSSYFFTKASFEGLFQNIEEVSLSTMLKNENYLRIYNTSLMIPF